MKTIFITIIALALLSSLCDAQTKQYAKPENKAYSFNLTPSKLDSIVQYIQAASSSFMDSDMPAKKAKELSMHGYAFINDLYSQLRMQVVRDSLAKLKK